MYNLSYDAEGVLKLRERIEKSESEYLAWVKKLVDIDSNTGNLAGSRKIAELLIPFLEKLGGKIERRENTRGVHIVARFLGKGEKKVLLYDHTDTVLPNRKDFSFSYDSKKKIAYGPGTSDSKGSVAFLLQTLHFFHRENFHPYRELILYLDAEEETGSELGDQIIEELAKEVDYAVVADGGRPDLGIVTRRKTLGKYTITIRGISGHAGNGAHACANALTQAGYLIVALDGMQSPFPEDPLEFTKEFLDRQGTRDFGQFVPKNTINVGVLVQSSDPKANIVPGYVKLDLELRCFEQTEHERLEKAIFDLAKSPYKKGIEITVEGRQEYKSVEAKGFQKKLSDLYSSLGKQFLGKEISHWQAGGVTPGNLMALHTPIIDGVGVDVDPALEHSIYEELFVDSYVPRLLLLLLFLEEADHL